MPRTPLTPAQRAANVRAAADELPALISRAMSISTQPGRTPDEIHRAWEAVEIHGATIHRQSRLLAGKSKGG